MPHVHNWRFMFRAGSSTKNDGMRYRCDCGRWGRWVAGLRVGERVVAYTTGGKMEQKLEARHVAYRDGLRTVP